MLQAFQCWVPIAGRVTRVRSIDAVTVSLKLPTGYSQRMRWWGLSCPRHGLFKFPSFKLPSGCRAHPWRISPGASIL